MTSILTPDGARCVRFWRGRGSDSGSWAISVPETITSATGQNWQSRNINNNFWLIPDTQDFGVWQ